MPQSFWCSAKSFRSIVWRKMAGVGPLPDWDRLPPGRARRKPLKPLRAGMPGDSGGLVVTRVRSTTTIAHETAGASGIRHSPRPQGREIYQRLGRMARRGRERVSGIRTTSLRAKRGSNPESVIPGWSQRVGALRRPMTGSGPDLRCAIAHRGISRFRVRCFASPRNDGVWIGSRSLSSGAHSRRPIAEYDGGSLTYTAWNP
jgi:hypothetical protein